MNHAELNLRSNGIVCKSLTLLTDELRHKAMEKLIARFGQEKTTSHFRMIGLTPDLLEKCNLNERAKVQDDSVEAPSVSVLKKMEF